MSTAVIQLLQADPDLAENMTPRARAQATGLIRARVFRVAKGPWQPPDINHGTTGLLVLSGLMIRSLRFGPVSSCEVVGPTDIIRPWENDLIPSLLPALADWRVLHEATVALLDAPVTALIGRWPELSAAVSGRLLRRSRSLAYLMAAQHFVRVESIAGNAVAPCQHVGTSHTGGNRGAVSTDPRDDGEHHRRQTAHDDDRDPLAHRAAASHP